MSMKYLKKLWASFLAWVKSLDEEWDQETAASARDCKDLQP